jgi:hypothetical protein
MVKLNIFYEDLKQDTQSKIWQQVQKELLARAMVDYREEDETEEGFQARLEEETDHYINCHNFANEFTL